MTMDKAVNEKIGVNKISTVIKIEDNNHPDIDKPLACCLCWVDDIEKQVLLDRLDKQWEEIKLQIVRLLYKGE